MRTSRWLTPLIAFSSVALLAACGSSNGEGASSTESSSSSASGSSHHGAGGGDGGTSGSGGGDGGGAGGLAGAPIRDRVGMNGFVNDPTELLAIGGVVREYHTWEWNQHFWDQTGEHRTGVDEMVFQGMAGTWNLDEFFERLKQAKVSVFPAISGTITALSGTTNFPKPMPQDADATDPASYEDHGKMMFQFAARYGSTAVDSSKLTLRKGQPVLTGAGYLTHIENGNEPNNIWAYDLGGQEMPQTAVEFAAMSSADYDGDEGRLGEGVGAKTADPKMQVVMAGLAGTAPPAEDAGWLENIKAYLQGIKDWSDEHRNGSFPADVVNLHHYCVDHDAGHGVAPEACGLEELIRNAREFTDELAPGKQFWITEFGYDRVQGTSWNEAIPVGPFDAETVQAQWLIRGTLAILLAGADRFTMYMSRDAGTDGLYATSGLAKVDLSNQALGTVTERFAVFDYFAAFIQRLGAMHLTGEIDSKDPGVRVVGFAHASGRRGFVLWSPTSEGKTVENYRLAVGSASAGKRVTLTKGSPNGEESALPVEGGKVTLDVSENPVIVLVE